MKNREKIKISMLILLGLSEAIAVAQSQDTLLRMLAENNCSLYGNSSDVCQSSRNDLLRGRSSNETTARMLANNNCNIYGESSEVCASSKRDIYEAIARDNQNAAYSRPSPGYTGSTPSNSSYLQPQGAREKNIITFINYSGEDALVKVIGPTNTQASIPSGASRSAHVDGGTYYILTRYGSYPPYRYSKGDSFAVTETSSQYSEMSITLHKVASGNYYF